jgi:ssDNA-binding replication factor A large subunit
VERIYGCVPTLQDVGESIEVHDEVWTPISRLTVESRSVNVRFSVIKKGTLRRVTARATGRTHLINKCVIGDESAIITLTLWNNDIDEVEVGKTYELLNGYISLYDECMNLSKGRWGKIRIASIDIVQVDGTVDMSRPFMGRPKRKRQNRSPTGRSFQGTPGRESKGYCSRKGF